MGDAHTYAFFLYAYAALRFLAEASNNKLVCHTDPNGHATQYAYNASSVSVTPGGGGEPTILVPYSVVQSITEPAGGVTTFAYDPATRTTVVTDARTNATTYRTNAYGSVVSIQDPVGTTTLTWAADDIVMTSKRDARGVLTEYAY
jgi:YD repeat-containing protein